MAGKRPESVLVVVHTRAGEVLLLRRAGRRPSFWQSVTGSLEPGEMPVQAARRELAEETGLAPDGLIDCRRRRHFFMPPSWRGRFEPDVTHNLEHEFHLELPTRADVRLAPGEHDACCWLPRAEAIERAASWTNRAAIRSLATHPSKATVVLVHGLWLGPWCMRLLARRLRRAGFRTVLFGYRTTGETPAQAGRRLGNLIDRLEGTTIHIVAHSLGGIVTAHMLDRQARGRIGRAVLLGTPMRGSAAAGALRDRGLGRLLGAARERGLDGGAPAWPRDVPVSVVAGIIAFGPGRMLLRLTGPHDGTVTVRETAVPGAHRTVVRATHVGLLTSRRVAAAVCEQLAGGPAPSAAPCRRGGPGATLGHR